MCVCVLWLCDRRKDVYVVVEWEGEGYMCVCCDCVRDVWLHWNGNLWSGLIVWPYM